MSTINHKMTDYQRNVLAHIHILRTINDQAIRSILADIIDEVRDGANLRTTSYLRDGSMLCNSLDIFLLESLWGIIDKIDAKETLPVRTYIKYESSDIVICHIVNPDDYCAIWRLGYRYIGQLEIHLGCWSDISTNSGSNPIVTASSMSNALKKHEMSKSLIDEIRLVHTDRLAYEDAQFDKSQPPTIRSEAC